MEEAFTDIKQRLSDFGIDLSEEQIRIHEERMEEAQQYFPLPAQKALAITLLTDWEAKKSKKIITACSQVCYIKDGPCVTSFGILSQDWPGLSNACLGVIHEMGWNIYFMKGFSINYQDTPLGIVIIGIRTDDEAVYKTLMAQTEKIESKLRQAAVGDSGKAYLLNEEMRKLEIYSRVITEIQRIYLEDDLEEIIGLNGEAVKYFAARSRDYIENRKIEDIARQIILNFTLIKKAHETGSPIQLDISNFETATEGTFTGVTVAGQASMLNLEDCLKTIELTIPNFLLKHNREFTTGEGISLYRIEFVDAQGNPLSESEQEKLRKGFDSLVLNKRRDRAQWIESIGGFEQYARAIIPLLVREAKTSEITQVYQSVGNATDLYIDFKIIIAVPGEKGGRRDLSSQVIAAIENTSGLQVLAIKPPKWFDTTQMFIVDIRASLTVISDTEMVYQVLRETLKEALGKFRDFDEGMRTMDATKSKTIRKHLGDMDKSLLRELYYGIEDFYRVTAPINEIVAHISLARDMIQKLRQGNESVVILHEELGTHTQSGKFIPRAVLVAIGYPAERTLLGTILKIFSAFDVTMSRLERSGNNILLCRITKNEKAPSKQDIKSLLEKLKRLNEPA